MSTMDDVRLLLQKVIDDSGYVQPSTIAESFDKWNNQPIPTKDSQKGTHPQATVIGDTSTNQYLRAATTLLKADRCTNAFVYPPMSYMPWHTNSDDPGQRMYLTFSPGKSWFKTENGIECDEPGWHVRSFNITSNELFWHTIFAEDIRYSFGFLYA